MWCVLLSKETCPPAPRLRYLSRAPARVPLSRIGARPALFVTFPPLSPPPGPRPRPPPPRPDADQPARFAPDMAHDNAPYLFCCTLFPPLAS